MQTYLVEAIGVAAALASLYAAYAETMVPLRAASIAANVLALVGALWLGLVAVAVVCALLLALNAFRLHQIRKLVRDIEQAIKGDLDATWLLPFTRPQRFKAGQVMMARGDYSTAAFYVVAGEVELVELGETFGKGTLIGEIGLFAPDGRRTLTARCKTDVEAARLDYERFKELYFENPQFGFRVLHLIVARLQHNAARAVVPT
ncbi:MAG TPA: cyclic nucleotide-binding domain-containing protein [Xanthobacteraceae bacterium]|nr:cyclic nucleotide-binding domain-containing protein [Xanthobacteraceae bacterium]